MLVNQVGLVIAFCFWIHRASKNLDALSVTRRRYTPGWAVGWWFVPIMNLFRPYQVVGEIWKGSDPLLTDTGSSAWHDVPTSAIVKWWWGICILFVVIENVIHPIWSLTDPARDELIMGQYMGVTGEALSIVAIVLAFFMVRQITSNQNKKYRRLGSSTESFGGS